MIFITSDTHGEPERLINKNLKYIKKFDTVIVLGDFGYVWKNNKQQEKILKKLSKLPFKILFLDGYSEDFRALEAYPDAEYGSAAAKEIAPGKIYYIKRGEILKIDGLKILCFGGDDDIFEDVFGENPPSQSDFDNCLKNLEKENWQVDYILTHSPSGTIDRFLNMESTAFGGLFDFLDSLTQKVTYKKWYFGFYHKDKFISSKSQAVYTGVYKLGE